ncbi:uncharacterized protein LOC123306688 [Coccinella septempunctata]|uniref:uncharacterized protein LOC123306688 n=1 Tax=Coccinella septempunctata TaxID=41139 RepID=UPI001D064041|nr:uncharacterized protein LOC123306688 [Coccinella septempunctata]
MSGFNNKYYCSVSQCKSSSRRPSCKGISFHNFPKKNERKVLVQTRLGSEKYMDRRQAWMYVLKIRKTLSKNMKVCSLHFTKEDFSQTSAKRFLKKNVVPSQNLPGMPVEQDAREKQNIEISKRRNERKERNDPLHVNQCESIISDPTTHSAHDVEAAHALLDLARTHAEVDETILGTILNESPILLRSSRDAEIQVDVPKVFTLCEFLKTPASLKFFTGLSNFRILDCIVHLVNKVHKDKRSRRLTARERIIMTFIKMKLDMSYVCLGILFNISNEMCKLYFIEMVQILSSVLKPTIYFPSSDENRANMPYCFKNFRNVRIILDCIEIFVQKPKCLCCRIKFYSQYKSSATVKFMTGVTPAGTICFVSEPYGGRASDKAIFEQSGVIQKLDPGKDAIMIDKGFMIEDMCAAHRIQLIRPPFLKKKKTVECRRSLFESGNSCCKGSYREKLPENQSFQDPA